MPQASRVAWVDYAKGFCIIMVVMMHSTLGVEKAAGGEGWMHAARRIRDALPHARLLHDLRPVPRPRHRPRLADLPRQEGRPLRLFLRPLADDPVRLQGAGIRRRGAARRGVGSSLPRSRFIDPFGTIWFIYLLPIFFVVAEATRGVPWWIIWLVGAALEMAPISDRLDDDRRVRRALRLFLLRLRLRAASSSASPSGVPTARPALGCLVLWGVHQRRRRSSPASPSCPVVSLASASSARRGGHLLGASVAERPDGAGPLLRRAFDRHLPRLLPADGRDPHRSCSAPGIIDDLGTISLIVTAAGVIVPLVLFWTVRGTPLRFLFERPAWARLEPVPVPPPARGMIHRRAVPH